jgi:hypothetical protein
MPKIPMTLVNGNGVYNNRSNVIVNNTRAKPARKVGMGLNTGMIGRIQNITVGCGGCGH